MTEEELRFSKLHARHETLVAAYREACTELEQIRAENEGLRGRLGGIHALCKAEHLQSCLEGIRILSEVP